MWFVAGALLGLVLLGSLLGLHTGPHTHLAAALAGAVSACWLAFMLIDGASRTPLLLGLLAADVLATGTLGFAARQGIASAKTLGEAGPASRVIGSHGVALSILDPEGIVRVQGEQWSATSVNGTIAEKDPIQVVGVEGIRLTVWGEHNLPPSGSGSLFELDAPTTSRAVDGADALPSDPPIATPVFDSDLPPNELKE